MGITDKLKDFILPEENEQEDSLKELQEKYETVSDRIEELTE